MWMEEWKSRVILFLWLRRNKMAEFIEDFFPEIERVIKGYDNEVKLLNSDSVCIENYPKVFTLCSASVFEKRIKDRIRLIKAQPAVSLEIELPQLYRIITSRPNDYVDGVFGKFVASNKTGSDVLDATKFYELFGGDSFKRSIQAEYNRLLENQKEHIDNQIVILGELLERHYSKYENDYADLLEMQEKLNSYTFERAEAAYLNLKLRRNKVAHYYMIETLDSFSDLRSFYYGASLYVAAVNNILQNYISEV